MNYRILLFAAASAASLLATAAAAQPAPAGEVEELVVTGSRGDARSRLESLAPVDVVSAVNLQKQGRTELAAALSATIPSIDFPRPANTDGTDAIRPATLRGQGPDQTLVLINGQRAHTAALLNINGSVGRGSAAVDLNTIPETAIDHIEVLRDGASALYGSDAIAGVVNVILRGVDHGGGASVSYGEYVTSFDGYYGGRRNITDGGTTTVSGWQGLKLGSDGFLTVSAQYTDRNHTNRSDVDPRVTPVRIDSRFGDGDVQDGNVYLNAAKPLVGDLEAFGFVGYDQKKSQTAATFRLPNDATQNIPSVYPNGYLPLLDTRSKDVSTGAGVRGTMLGFKSNISLDYGWNQIDFNVENTLNPSLGPTSPHAFYAGQMTYDQWVGNADFNRDFDLGLAGRTNVAFGLEARREGFAIGAGEPGSYTRGTVRPDLALGSRGFTGFTPSNVVDKHRTNVGVYLAVEGKLIQDLTGSVAVRQEHYSDFGDNTSGKVSLRYDVTPAWAFRGSAETGFRAPSLQQQYFTSTAIVFVNNVPFETGTYPSTSAVGKALGGEPLKPETSKNYSLGTVFHANGFELTVDAYEIDVNDRIVLSEILTGSSTAAAGSNALALYNLLSPLGASAARFFLNGVNTKTQGVDVVAHYRILDDQAGTFDLTASGNINDFKVTQTPTTKQTVLPTPVSLFARQAVLRFEDGTPKWKSTLEGDWSRENWGATVRTTFYGDVLSPGTLADGSADVHSGVRGIVDLEGRYTLPHNVTVALGADNVFDQYPQQITPNNNTTGAAPFTSFSPFGFNGRFIYGRVSMSW
ncbi:TonB-dependent receptor [Phenylobacterium hankyongense]|uniref:TonB-dependent receptor n=1 Tax=Phenylobacterium hankyongense TaxID=1813876 RepID=A0A328B8G8_9CAUL|nr:TonB-dependent receptor [Phenylobacterium hankyongense]RAK61278.1 TonB-dependent receptor [Phenylobacterium hankyongense]